MISFSYDQPYINNFILICTKEINRMEKSFKEMSFKEEWVCFIYYLKNNKIMCFLTILFSLIAYGIPMTQYTLSIDEESAMFRNEGNISIWSTQGRFGISLIKILLGYQANNSVTSTFIAILLLSISAMLWAYILSNVSINKSNPNRDIKGIIIALIFVTFPAYAENIGFSIMSIELGIGWIITAIATLLATRWALFKKNNMYMISSVLLMVLATSIYQSFIPVALCGMSLVTILHLNFLYKQQENIVFFEYIKVLFKYILITFMSMLIYKIVDKIVGLFVPPSDYISSFFGWGKQDIYSNFQILFMHYKDLIFGNLIYGSFIILPSMILLLLILILFLIRIIKNGYLKNTNYMIFIFFILFMVTPFLMSFLIGSLLPIRGELVWSIFISGVWFLFYTLFKDRKLKVLIFIFACYFSFHQSIAVSQLFAGDYNRYQQDVILANKIDDKIQQLNLGEAPNLPVVFIGKHQQLIDQNIIKQEVLGFSFFEWDNGNQYRINNFMRSLGHVYKNPSEDQINKALTDSIKMPKWPLKGSIALKNGLIIVKLSEDIKNHEIILLHNENKEVKTNSEVYNLNFKLKNMKYSKFLKPNIKNRKLVLISKDTDPSISLSFSKIFTQESFDYVSIELNSNIEGEMQIFLAEKNGEYSEDNAKYIHINKGYNLIFCKPSKVMDQLSSIRIDPPNQSTIRINNVKLVK